MTLEEFEDALDLYGARVADWPEAERLGAAAVLAGSAEARTMLATAEEISALLAKTRVGRGISDGVGLDRIVAVATASPQQRARAVGVRLPRAGWRYAACVAVALTGFALGVADGLRQAAPLSPIVSLAFGSMDPFDAL
jgi:hypothetical protein